MEVKKLKFKNRRMVIITFANGNAFSAVSYRESDGYRYFGERVADAENLVNDEKDFYKEIASAKYDTFLTCF